MFWKWKKSKKFRKWLKEDDAKLLDLKKSGLSDEAIAKKLGRSVPAIRLRYYQLTKPDDNDSSVKGSSSQNITLQPQNITLNTDLFQLAQQFGLGQNVLSSLIDVLDKRIEDKTKEVISKEEPKIIDAVKNAIAQLIEGYAKKYENIINSQDQLKSAPSENINPVFSLLSHFLSPKEPDVNEIVERRVNAEMDRIYKFIRLGTLIAKRGAIKKEDLEGLL